MLECVVNISEGRRPAVVTSIAHAAGDALLDVHSDWHHHRSVLTLAGPELGAAVRALAARTVASVDLRVHDGAHPRLGALDVVPFVPLGGADLTDAMAARDACAEQLAIELGLPCFLYGPERPLPDVRREAFISLAPDHGPARPDPTAGAVAVGARPLLVAFNLWLADADLPTARAVAASVRRPGVRTLGLRLGDRCQVSCNLIDPTNVGPGEVYDAVARRATVQRAELVGLVPRAVLDATPEERWAQLDLDPARTIEARLAVAGLDGGSSGQVDGGGP